VQYNLALTYSQLNRFDDASEPLERALKRWPDLFPLNALYGAVLVKLGDDSHAYEVLQHARELNPQDVSTAELLYVTTLKMADREKKSRQYSSALRYYDEAARLRPQDAEPHRNMADIYAQLGKTAKAAEEKTEADRLSSH
jgi:tetratricopeptide (TPR) repeat protein